MDELAKHILKFANNTLQMYEKGDKSIMPKMVALNMDGRIPAAQNRQI